MRYNLSRRYLLYRLPGPCSCYLRGPLHLARHLPRGRHDRRERHVPGRVDPRGPACRAAGQLARLERDFAHRSPISGQRARVRGQPVRLAQLRGGPPRGVRWSTRPASSPEAARRAKGLSRLPCPHARTRCMVSSSCSSQSLPICALGATRRPFGQSRLSVRGPRAGPTAAVVGFSSCATPIRHRGRRAVARFGHCSHTRDLRALRDAGPRVCGAGRRRERRMRLLASSARTGVASTAPTARASRLSRWPTGCQP